jgi:hypothetical protein
MLKYWLALLLVLNAAVLAWQWDAFARWGHGPNAHREPERLQQQVRPEALKFEVMPPASATATLPALPDANALPPDAEASAPAADASAPAADASAPAAASPAPALPAPTPSSPQAPPR